MADKSVTYTAALACDRAELKTGIVHFGVGGFHRAHQQVGHRYPITAANVFLWGLPKEFVKSSCPQRFSGVTDTKRRAFSPLSARVDTAKRGRMQPHSAHACRN
jgi:hypothetical protein